LFLFLLKVEKTTKKKGIVRFLLAEKPKGNPPLTKENLTKGDIEKHHTPIFISFTFFIRRKTRKSLSFGIGMVVVVVFSVPIRASLIARTTVREFLLGERG